MGELERKLKNSVFRIYDNTKELLPSVNGIIEEHLLSGVRVSSIYRATRSLEGFVKVTQDYPEIDHTEVEVETDLIVLTTKNYKDILKKIQRLEQGTIPKSINKYGN